MTEIATTTQHDIELWHLPTHDSYDQRFVRKHRLFFPESTKALCQSIARKYSPMDLSKEQPFFPCPSNDHKSVAYDQLTKKGGAFHAGSLTYVETWRKANRNRKEVDLTDKGYLAAIRTFDVNGRKELHATFDDGNLISCNVYNPKTSHLQSSTAMLEGDTCITHFFNSENGNQDVVGINIGEFIVYKEYDLDIHIRTSIKPDENDVARLEKNYDFPFGRSEYMRAFQGTMRFEPSGYDEKPFLVIERSEKDAIIGVTSKKLGRSFTTSEIAFINNGGDIASVENSKWNQHTVQLAKTFRSFGTTPALQ